MKPAQILKTAASLVTLTAALWTGTAQAILIEYELADLGSNKYRYEYTVTNNGTLLGAAPVEAFLIAFDETLYKETSLQHVTPGALSTQWYEEILGSVPAISPADYSADASGNLLQAIANGTSLGKFMVEFEWMGSGLPGSQPFEIYDLDNTDPVNLPLLLVESGQTQLRQVGPEQVPEPAVLALFGMGFLVMNMTRRRNGFGISPSASQTF
jgi:hypothetical protein